MVHDPDRQPHDDGSASGAKRPAFPFHLPPAPRGRLELAFADLRDRLDASVSRTGSEERAVQLKSCHVEPIVFRPDGTYGLPTLTLAFDRRSLAVIGWHLD